MMAANLRRRLALGGISAARSMATMFLAALVTVTTVSPSRADLQNELSNMLGVNVQVNNPTSVETSRRAGFFGGSVYVRGRVMSVNVLNFTPPSFSAGCGGIDMFGGSFTMINKEQFVALLRSVAQNAAGYAFHLALKNICEQCSTILANLQRVIQEMNAFTGNSCQLAKGIVNTGLDALEMSDVKGKQETAMTAGFADAFDAFWGSINSAVSSLTATNADGTTNYDKFRVNVVWEGLRENGVSGWFTYGDKSLMEALMTLTGTIILDGPANDTSGNASQNIQRVISGGGLSIRDILEGNESAKVLQCNDSEKCLTTGYQTVEVVGIKRTISNALVGLGPGDPSSILYRLINGTGTSDDSDAMIGRLGTYGTMLLELARNAPKGDTSAYTFFNEVKDIIAYEVVALFVQDAVSAVNQAISSKDYATAYAEDWRRTDFANTMLRVSQELQTYSEKIPDRTQAISTFIQLNNYHLLRHSPFN
ncbi:hypothetical protein D2T29_12205 [Sinirhodobacter populi]|uniref:Conjugal transfer protein TraH n=1 Tax=Paenirhodobacter populi TaxID=2306993 RepID=A0A443KC80_9RHOB|nr:conjugal transfer protein TraH [Sinirhodobacter populi]RWR30429.1 hypothetical protein D2T29_12205 [Sinirhodobacter populi]